MAAVKDFCASVTHCSDAEDIREDQGDAQL